MLGSSALPGLTTLTRGLRVQVRIPMHNSAWTHRTKDCAEGNIWFGAEYIGSG
jgi:hypothetical protein